MTEIQQLAELLARNLALEMQLAQAERERDALATALRAFADAFSGDLDGVGGGTLVAPSLPLQLFKDAKRLTESGR